MKQSIKEKILIERGLIQKQPAPKKHRRFKAGIKPQVSGKSKTPLMKYLEQKYREPIEDILVSGSLAVVAKKLDNEVDTSTLGRWIKRFRLRYSEDNLPSCEDCKMRGAACEGGICYVLINLELWDLIPIKKQEVLNEGNPHPNPTAP